jgi:hypothetical protein
MLERMNAWMPSTSQRNDMRMLFVLIAPSSGSVQVSSEMTEFAQSIFIGQRAQVGFFQVKAYQRERCLFDWKTGQASELLEKPAHVQSGQTFARYIAFGS